MVMKIQVIIFWVVTL